MLIPMLILILPIKTALIATGYCLLINNTDGNASGSSKQSRNVSQFSKIVCAVTAFDTHSLKLFVDFNFVQEKL